MKVYVVVTNDTDSGVNADLDVEVCVFLTFQKALDVMMETVRACGGSDDQLDVDGETGAYIQYTSDLGETRVACVVERDLNG